MNNTKYFLMLAIGGLILSLSGIAVAYSSMGTSAMGFYRMLLGGTGILICALFLKVNWKMSLRAFIYAAIAGIALAVDIYWWHQSIRIIGPGLAAILTNCQAFFLAIFAYLIFKEKITIIYVVSLLIAAAGVMMISWSGISIQDQENSRNFIYGIILGIASAVAYAACVVCIKIPQSSENDQTHPMASMTVLCFSAALFLLACTFFNYESLAIPDTNNLIAIILYGFLVQGLAWLLVSVSVTKVKASVAALILLSEPIGTYIIDVIYFSASPTILAVIGISLTIAAIYFGSLYGTQRPIAAVKNSSQIR